MTIIFFVAVEIVSFFFKQEISKCRSGFKDERRGIVFLIYFSCQTCLRSFVRLVVSSEMNFSFLLGRVRFKRKTSDDFVD